jgi:hypothetical protein
MSVAGCVTSSAIGKMISPILKIFLILNIYETVWSFVSRMYGGIAQAKASPSKE